MDNKIRLQDGEVSLPNSATRVVIFHRRSSLVIKSNADLLFDISMRIYYFYVRIPHLNMFDIFFKFFN